MSRRIFRIIILLSFVSLLAALITQLLWVRDALQLKEDQFTSKVEIAMQSLVNHLMVSADFPPAEAGDYPAKFYREHEELLNVVNPDVLDSLLQMELNAMRIDRNCKYGVYRQKDQQFVMGPYEGYEDLLVISEHQVSLSCICQDHSYLLSLFYPNQTTNVLSQMLILPVMSGLFLIVLIFSFFFTIFSLIRQKKLSEMKTDFVNNMTHEFKTPISTISISSEMLQKDLVAQSPEKVKKYAQIIFDENARLKNQVEGVLQIAIFDKGDYKLKMRELDIHEIIGDRVKNFQVQVQERKGKLDTCLKASDHIIVADKIHIANIINNLLDNANKYSPEPPDILVSTRNKDGQILIMVEDKGLGISRENQTHIYKKFHRLHTGDIHDVKGFGLGLFYVKTMVEEMGGTIELKSELNKGSCFIVSFKV
jgi:two-component system phosphate regulon sensor histidine kinase PhoR